MNGDDCIFLAKLALVRLVSKFRLVSTDDTEIEFNEGEMVKAGCKGCNIKLESRLNANKNC